MVNFQGLQKLTLLDYPGHTACTLFTGGCNLRCPWCHNVPLVLDPNGETPFSEEEILSYLDKRRGVLDGIAVTGGEPLLQKDIGMFLEKVKCMGLKVKLDSNGSFPQRLKELLDNGLVDYVAMDIKNSKTKYALTCGKPGLDIKPFEQSVEILLTGSVEYEFRTTVIKEFHTPEDIRSVGEWLKGAKQYYLQAFKDSGILMEGSASAPKMQDMEKMAEIAREYIQLVGLRGV